jgi:hypothetical protein
LRHDGLRRIAIAVCQPAGCAGLFHS